MQHTLWLGYQNDIMLYMFESMFKASTSYQYQKKLFYSYKNCEATYDNHSQLQGKQKTKWCSLPWPNAKVQC
jgi:hypothetical protein